MYIRLLFSFIYMFSPKVLFKGPDSLKVSPSNRRLTKASSSVKGIWGGSMCLCQRLMKRLPYQRHMRRLHVSLSKAYEESPRVSWYEYPRISLWECAFHYSMFWQLLSNTICSFNYKLKWPWLHLRSPNPLGRRFSSPGIHTWIPYSVTIISLSINTSSFSCIRFINAVTTFSQHLTFSLLNTYTLSWYAWDCYIQMHGLVFSI